MSNMSRELMTNTKTYGKTKILKLLIFDSGLWCPTIGILVANNLTPPCLFLSVAVVLLAIVVLT